MKKFLIVLLTFIIMLIPCLTVSAEELEDHSAESFNAFSELTTAWAENGLEMYPDYVGGVYFDSDMSLVVALCEDSEANRNTVLSLTQYPDVIRFVSVSYSYAQLQDIVDEVTYNCDNGNYNFLVNFANIVEDQNIVEISVGSSDLAAATSYFASLYGDKVTVYGGYDTVSDTDYVEESGGSVSEKIAGTASLRRYISIGIIAVLIIAVLVMTLAPAKSKKAAPRRYRK